MESPEPIFFFLVIGSALLTIWMISSALRLAAHNVGEFGNGLLGVASVMALLVGSLLYYLEGRGEPRIDSSVAVTIVPLEPGIDGPRVLVQLVGIVTNRGAFSERFECVAIDVRGFRPAPDIPRNWRWVYDVNTEPLMKETAKGRRWEKCLEAERARWDAQESRRIWELRLPAEAAERFMATNSGFRYEPYDLLAGESKAYDAEVTVPCDYAAIRVHFVVPKPGRDSYHDTKKVYGIQDTCRESREQGQAIAEAAKASRKQSLARGGRRSRR